MEWDCAAKVALMNEAEFPLSAILASIVLPSLNVIVPVGVPEVAGCTVAVNVTDFPYTDGFAEETREVVVGAEVMLAEASVEFGLSPLALMALTT
jgi:hypothetical protein